MRRRIMASVGGKPLPYKRRLAYLESTGTQFVNTMYKASTAKSFLRIRIRIDSNNQSASLFGSRNTNGADDSSCNVFVIGSNLRFDWSRIDSNTLSFETGKIYDIEMTRGYLRFDGVEYVGTNKTDISQNNDFALFATYQTTGVLFNPKAKAKIYYAEMMEEGLPIFNLKPVMAFDDEPCFYDAVSGKLFRNAGTGTFDYGELET